VGGPVIKNFDSSQFSDDFYQIHCISFAECRVAYNGDWNVRSLIDRVTSPNDVFDFIVLYLGDDDICDGTHPQLIAQEYFYLIRWILYERKLARKVFIHNILTEWNQCPPAVISIRNELKRFQHHLGDDVKYILFDRPFLLTSLSMDHERCFTLVGIKFLSTYIAGALARYYRVYFNSTRQLCSTPHLKFCIGCAQSCGVPVRGHEIADHYARNNEETCQQLPSPNLPPTPPTTPPSRIRMMHRIKLSASGIKSSSNISKSIIKKRRLSTEQRTANRLLAYRNFAAELIKFEQ